VVTAFEMHLNEEGHPRIRCEYGWTNVIASDGTVLLQPL
jgi:hypothetical protein